MSVLNVQYDLLAIFTLSVKVSMGMCVIYLCCLHKTEVPLGVCASVCACTYFIDKPEGGKSAKREGKG